MGYYCEDAKNFYEDLRNFCEDERNLYEVVRNLDEDVRNLYESARNLCEDVKNPCEDARNFYEGYDPRDNECENENGEDFKEKKNARDDEDGANDQDDDIFFCDSLNARFSLGRSKHALMSWNLARVSLLKISYQGNKPQRI